jgi:hypothetical protein
MSDDILRQEIDGIEYFTIASTGESGMSQRGLSRLCGVQHRAIQKMLENLANKTASEWLQILVGQDFYLAKKTAVKGGETTPIKAINAVSKHNCRVAAIDTATLRSRPAESV